jgi:hypothetical protein
MGFIDISVNLAGFFGQASVEKPVIQWKEFVCGITWNKGCAVDNCGFFESCFGAAVNCNVHVAAKSLCSFDYPPLYAPKVQMRRLRVEDG